jgi:hypothetical protein
MSLLFYGGKMLTEVRYDLSHSGVRESCSRFHGVSLGRGVEPQQSSGQALDRSVVK